MTGGGLMGSMKEWALNDQKKVIDEIGLKLEKQNEQNKQQTHGYEIVTRF